MFKQIFIVIILYLSINSIVFSDNLLVYFPNEIDYRPVSLYLQKKKITDSEQAYYEYKYILMFIEKAMYAHEVNIRNYHAKNTLIKLTPMFKDGNLIIDEAVEKIYFVDTGSDYIYERLHVDVMLEYINFLCCINTYNTLLYFWFEKTGVMLGSELVFEKEVTRIDDPRIQSLFNGK